MQDTGPESKEVDQLNNTQIRAVTGGKPPEMVKVGDLEAGYNFAPGEVRGEAAKNLTGVRKELKNAVDRAVTSAPNIEVANRVQAGGDDGGGGAPIVQEHRQGNGFLRFIASNPSIRGIMLAASTSMMTACGTTGAGLVSAGGDFARQMVTTGVRKIQDENLIGSRSEQNENLIGSRSEQNENLIGSGSVQNENSIISRWEQRARLDAELEKAEAAQGNFTIEQRLQLLTRQHDLALANAKRQRGPFNEDYWLYRRFMITDNLQGGSYQRFLKWQTRNNLGNVHTINERARNTTNTVNQYERNTTNTVNQYERNRVNTVNQYERNRVNTVNQAIGAGGNFINRMLNLGTKLLIKKIN